MKCPAVAQTTLQTIGNTPLVRLNRVVPGDDADIIVKLEAFNPSGSYKNRMALAMIEGARRIAETDGACWTNQFHNTDSIDGYCRIGEELLAQIDTPLDAFCAGVGTAGMLVGVSLALCAAGSAARIVALEPASAAVISTGRPGAHHVEGVGVGFVPPLLTPGSYDDARGIDEGEARQMARRLAREEGIFAGTSTGLNIVGALHLARELGPGRTVATVACDSGLKYLHGDLFVAETDAAVTNLG
jgi:cysteine synthase A